MQFNWRSTEMKSFSNMPYYSSSFAIHLLAIGAIIAISSYRTLNIPVFQTSVVFEPVKSTKVVSGKTKTSSSKKKKQAVPQSFKTKLKRPETEKMPAGVDISEIFNRSDTIKESEFNYLRSNKKTEKRETNQNKDSKKTNNKNPSLPLSDNKPTSNVKNESNVDKSQNRGSLSIWKKKNELVSYRNVLRSIVKANWTVPPVALKSFEIRIEARIDSNGNLLDLILIKSSGLIMLNSAAEKAIRVSTPFGKVPKSILNDKQEFHATFRFTPNEVSN